MYEVIAWVTFAGAWLLVAGPLYQGSVELGELDIDREGSRPSRRRRAERRRGGGCCRRSSTCCTAAGPERSSTPYSRIEHHRWPVWLFCLLIVVMLGVAVLNTAVRMISGDHTRRPVGAEPAPSAEQR